MAEDERAKRLAAEVRAATESTVFDMASCSGAGPISQLVNAGFGQPLPLAHMVRLSFIVGGGKKVRQRYDDNWRIWVRQGGSSAEWAGLARADSLPLSTEVVLRKFLPPHRLPQILSEALKSVGYVEDRGASCTDDCQGLFKYQHDTDKDLKFVHVFPKLDASKAASGGEVEDSLSPAQLLVFSEMDTFKAMIAAKTPTFSQRKRALDALKASKARIASLEEALTAMKPLSDDEQSWYDAVDAEGLGLKISWLAQTLEKMVDDGQLTAKEREEVLSRMEEKAEELSLKLSAAEAAGKAKAVTQLTAAREELQKKMADVRNLKCITHRPKHAAEIQAVKKKLAALEKLEKSKVVLPLEEVQKLSAKPKLLADLHAMEVDSAGWFSEPS